MYVPRRDRPVMSGRIAGIGYWGSMTAGELVTSREQIDKIRASAPHSCQHKNLEIVLSTDVIDGLPGPPKVLATYFW